MKMAILLDTGLFFGRFHPLVVHLPIGFLLLALLLAVFDRKSGRFDAAISFSLLAGAASAWLACLFGWLLAQEGGYSEDLLGRHQWLGIGTAALASLLWLGKAGLLKLPAKAQMPGLLLMTGALSLAGHLGGSLTHGENYLVQYAPGFLGKMLNASAPQAARDLQHTRPDSVVVFADLVQPVLEQKCFACHNDSKQNGGLQMNNHEALMKGGDNGKVIAAGNATGSELFRRVTLNPESVKFMPPKGSPMSYREKMLLKWWLDNGADFEMKVSEMEVPEEIQQILLAETGLDTRPRPLVETLQAPAYDAKAMQQLQERGFFVSPLAENVNLLEVRATAKTGKLQAADFETLQQLAPQITWLNLSETGLQDTDLASLNGMEMLTRLRLSGNPLTDKGLSALAPLKNLESLNLYGTSVTDATLQHLASFPQLKKLYLWQTGTTPQGIDQLKNKLPRLEVDTGFAFKTVTAQAD